MPKKPRDTYSKGSSTRLPDIGKHKPDEKENVITEDQIKDWLRYIDVNVKNVNVTIVSQDEGRVVIRLGGSTSVLNETLQNINQRLLEKGMSENNWTSSTDNTVHFLKSELRHSINEQREREREARLMRYDPMARSNLTALAPKDRQTMLFDGHFPKLKEKEKRKPSSSEQLDLPPISGKPGSTPTTSRSDDTHTRPKHRPKN